MFLDPWFRSRAVARIASERGQNSKKGGGAKILKKERGAKCTLNPGPIGKWVLLANRQGGLGPPVATALFHSACIFGSAIDCR